MAMTIHCDIASAEEKIFSSRVEFIVAAGVQGDMGVYPGHAPLLTELQPGPIRVVKQNGEEEIFYVSGGYLEVQPDVVTVLADTAVRADDMDEANALEAIEEAKRSIGKQTAEMEYGRAAAQLAEAAAQIRTIQQLKKKLGKG
jgi:F-type H+-transporting ATPase subunit epsilon